MRLIVLRLRDAVETQQRRVAVEGNLTERDLRLLRRDVVEHACVVVLHGEKRQPRLAEIGLDVVERDAELPGIDAEKHLSFSERSPISQKARDATATIATPPIISTRRSSVRSALTRANQPGAVETRAARAAT